MDEQGMLLELGKGVSSQAARDEAITRVLGAIAFLGVIWLIISMGINCLNPRYRHRGVWYDETTQYWDWKLFCWPFQRFELLPRQKLIPQRFIRVLTRVPERDIKVLP